MVCWISFPLLFAENLKKKRRRKKCFSNCCYHLTPYKRGYTVYIMMVCCTTTWTLGKNIWTIVFIWARSFLLPIKQPSSYKCVFSSMCLTFQPPPKAGCSREPPRAAFHVSTLLASHHFVRIISLLWIAACETERCGNRVMNGGLSELMGLLNLLRTPC